MFKDRNEAGRMIADKLKGKPYLKDAVVVAIPRGGIVVGKVVSEILNLPFFSLVIKKISSPQNPELALGAIGNGGVVFWDDRVVENSGLTKKDLASLKKEKYQQVKERERFLDLKSPNVKNKAAIVVDDGVATGSTAITASLILKNLGASKAVLATPVISSETHEKLKRYFDDIEYILKPADFSAVGEFYKNFEQISDEQVKQLLN
ncbi:MAG: hypothetical protein A2857_03090 [Candidatus Levybacteria bacterium RIFCSPHIGHO2_01_FULL_36_15]|nr:MAG: hypothetical protein A2857_03090 [Candidatus Levybacteria bacterium RIFCSPHIGHO2_01_FULL_36_15]OGH38236.1 MAG: hypothetical protein A2905_03320 [Candidatus Levybacteria bacterium RIFCSPLOWO2_01_FULL_36_10]